MKKHIIMLVAIMLCFLNVNMTLSLTGSTQKKYEYSDYGQRSLDSKTEIINNEFGYNGEAHTVDGLQYLRSRYYDPVTGVFISADNYRGSLNDLLSQNRYTYCDTLDVVEELPDSVVKEINASEKGNITIDDIIDDLPETTNGKGIARNFESTGGFEQTINDFDSLNPSDVKEIQAKYGPGKVGQLIDGTTVIARPGSSTGGATLEIKVSNNKVYKIRY